MAKRKVNKKEVNEVLEQETVEKVEETNNVIEEVETKEEETVVEHKEEEQHEEVVTEELCEGGNKLNNHGRHISSDMFGYIWNGQEFD